MSDGIRSRVLRGLAWKAGSQMLLQISRMVVALVLARLLAPHDWGLAAMILVFSGFVVVFTDSALGGALVQRRDLTEADRSTVFWTSGAIGAVLMLGGIALAGPLAAFYGEPKVEPLFAVLSISFLVNALRTTHTAVLVRELRFAKLESAQMASTLVGAVVGVTIAVKGFGAWAIVGQQVAEATVFTSVLFVVTPWRPSRTFSFGSLRRLAGFAGNLFGENLLYQAGRNIGPLLIGRFLGPASVGAYALATNVILVPFSRIAAPLQQVFFPAFSLMSDDRDRMGSVWIRATRLVGAISIPALVGLVIVAPDFVDAVLGPKWSDATTVIRILAIVGIVQSLQTLNGEVLLALGLANWLFRFTIVWFVASVTAFAVGLQWGIVGVAASSAVATILIEPLRTYLTTRALGMPFLEVLRSLSGVAQATAVMGVVVLVARIGLLELGVGPAARLVLLAALGIGIYVLACLRRAPELVREVGELAGRRAPASPRVDGLEPPLLEL